MKQANKVKTKYRSYKPILMSSQLGYSDIIKQL